MLFTEKPRTRIEPKRPGEGEFAFYNSAARPEFDVYRKLLNGWIAEFPAEHRAEMIARFRKTDSLAYQAALAELIIHAALVRRGYDVEVHPKCNHPTRRPDYRARGNDGEPVAYVEVTTFGPASDDVAQSNSEADILNAINKASLPAGCYLAYDVQTYGASAPSLNKLRRSIEIWAASFEALDREAPPKKVFRAEDWEIELSLLSGFRTDRKPERAIGAMMSDVRWLSAEVEIREALERKGNRYGNFDAPYLIVVADCKDELTGGDSNLEELIDAVYGTLITQVSGTLTRDVRRPDGYFGAADAPRHRNVSAVLLLPRSHIWNLRSDQWQPICARHHAPSYALPDDLLPVPGIRVSEECDIVPHDGMRLADILGLPTPWPPEGT